MSESPWLPHPVIGVIGVVLLLFLIAALANHKRETQCADQTPAQQCEETAHRAFGTIFAFTNQPPNPNQNPSREEWRSERDLYAQRQMAEAAWYAVIAAMLGVAVTAAGVVYVKFTLDATRGMLREASETTKAAAISAGIAERHFTIGERPWLSVSLNIVGDLVIANRSLFVDIAFVLKNTGKSPATNILFDYEFIPNSDDALDHIVIMNSRQLTTEREFVTDPDFRLLGAVVFPNEEVSRNVSLTLNHGDVGDREYMWPAIVGTAVYRSAFSDRPNHTGFVFYLSIIDEERPNIKAAIRVSDGTISGKTLSAKPSFISGIVD